MPAILLHVFRLRSAQYAATNERSKTYQISFDIRLQTSKLVKHLVDRFDR